MRKKIGAIISLIIIAGCILFISGYYVQTQTADAEIKQMASPEKGKSLLEIYKENPDVVGWIRVPGADIDYPVMNSDAYLYQNVKREYSKSGTPFIMDDWDEMAAITMIYGHNMWVEGTFFNPLHKYKKEDFWEKNRTAEYFVIRGKGASPYVEKRTYNIHAACLTSINDKLYNMCSEVDDASSAQELYETAKQEGLYRTDVNYAGDDELVLCTCSYHISGDRHAGRLLVIGTRSATEQKDINE